MKIRDLMTAKPITVDLDTPVLEARQIMLGKRIRHLLITDGPKLAGMVTDRDIRLNLPSPGPRSCRYRAAHGSPPLGAD